MTQPKLARSVRGKGRHYVYPPPSGDPSYPSVTNVIGVYDSGSPGLLGWFAENGITERLNCSLCDTGHPDVHCKNTDKCGCDGLEGTERHEYHSIRYHKWAGNRARNKAADRGDRAHTLAEALSLDTPLPSSISDEDEKYADAYLSFVADHDPNWLHVETTFYSTEHRYAGTADWVAEIGGQMVLGDYKSKPTLDKAKAYDEHWLQLAALMFHTDLWDGERLADPVKCDAGMVVFLTPVGYVKYSKSRSELERYFDWFCDLRRVLGHKNGSQ